MNNILLQKNTSLLSRSFKSRYLIDQVTVVMLNNLTTFPFWTNFLEANLLGQTLKGKFFGANAHNSTPKTPAKIPSLVRSPILP